MSEETIMEKVYEEMDKHLENYLLNGYTTFSYDVIEGKGPKVVLKTISLTELLEVEASMKGVQDGEIAIYRMHVYQLEYLSKVLKQFGNASFAKSEDAKAFLKTKGIALLDQLLKVQQALEKSFKKEFTPEAVENFTTTPSIDTKQD